MLVPTRPLGNTLTDVGTDINNGDFQSIPIDVYNGLMSNDGWAILLTVTAVYVVFRVIQRTLQAPAKVTKKVKSSMKSTRRKIGEKIGGIK